ncbi:MAG TPA: glycosyltransferase [Actinocrinis sp.]|jgi:UDP:flavonoid glycosyltransferase YjiC (YdhE family)
MRIVQIAIGTRGDVMPALTIGKALQERGAKVRVVAGTDLAGDVERAGLEPGSAGVDFKEVMMSEAGLDVIESGNGANFITLTRKMKRLFTLHGPTMMRAAYEACADADAVITSYTSDVFGVSIAEKLGIPHISTSLQPVPVATGAGQAIPSAPFKDRDSAINHAFHKVAIEPFNWRLMGAVTNDLRRDVLGLPAQRRRAYQRTLERSLLLWGVSPSVVPHPRDWPDNIHTTGYWFPPSEPEWTAPKELLDFLEDGEPPVFAGFGSITTRDPRRTTQLLAEAAAAAGARLLVQAGWAGLGDDDMPRGCLTIGSVPHEWLFPRVAAVVHHGGCGTTAAGLRAGLPSVVVPHSADQPFWGERITELKVGRAIPWSKLTAGVLAAALREALENEALRRRAAELGTRIRAEDGIGVASALIADHLKLSAAPAPATSQGVEADSGAGHPA